ncbi:MULTISPECIES: hypothetical protein [Bacillus]|uniref:hypothetical protein n=1 Tax=Bacillus TaxID=1386 RepID=UPI00273DAE21|nr:hypothetical protein [Bacillus sp. MMSF_3328]
MEKYFDIPTKDKLERLVKNEILNSSNIELEERYKEVTYHIKFCPSRSVIPVFIEEKRWILEEMKKRNIKAPTFFNKLLNWI